MLHEFPILKAGVIQHSIDSRGIDVEKLKQLDVLVVRELRPLLEH